jgi:hypothetical protein
MATTGIFLRRDTKANLIIDPPLVGEIVFALDTSEYGVLHNTEVIWRNTFAGPGVMVVGTIEERDMLSPRQNDFCFVSSINNQYIFIDDIWVQVSDINDSSISSESTWSSAKIQFELNNLQMDLGSY